MELSPQAKALKSAEGRVATYEARLAAARAEVRDARALVRNAIIDDLDTGTMNTDAIGQRHGVTGGRVRQIRAELAKGKP